MTKKGKSKTNKGTNLYKFRLISKNTGHPNIITVKKKNNETIAQMKNRVKKERSDYYYVGKSYNKRDWARYVWFKDVGGRESLTGSKKHRFNEWDSLPTSQKNKVRKEAWKIEGRNEYL